MQDNFYYCDYFRAYIERTKTLYATAFLRSFEHLCFDRCLDNKSGLHEFFVPPDQTGHFLIIMDFLCKQGLVQNLQQDINRLVGPEAGPKINEVDA